MKIAITSPNGKTIAGHAGKCPGYLVHDIQEGEILSKERVKLAKEQVFKNFSGPLSDNPEHPLNGIQVFISQSLGEGLQGRLARDGIHVLVTEATEPDEVVQSIIKV